jgi:hypothetical protein
VGRGEAEPDVRAAVIPSLESRLARRDLVVAAVTIVGLSRLLEGPTLWLVAALLLGAMLLGTLQVLAEDDPAARMSGVPVESLILPAVAAIACLGAVRLVPLGLWLVPALLLTALLVHRCLALEGRIVGAAEGLGPDDRTAVLVAILLVGFLAFVGAAALVPGGIVETAPTGSTAGTELGETNLLVLAVADGLVAFLLGYRAAAVRTTSFRDALASAVMYGAAIAIGAAALRAMAIPRLIGPALLTLAFYLWDAFIAAPPARRRDRRVLGQTAVLAVLGGVVIAWNLLLRT